MIPIIGILIGIYTAVRFMQFLGRKDEQTFIKVASALALVVTAFLMLALLTTGTSASSLR